MRCNRVLQAVFVVAVRILSVASKALPNVLNATPTLFTYQGYVSDADKAHPVVVHVLVKAKLLQSGVYLMRAVLYTQKTRLESKLADGLLATGSLCGNSPGICRRRSICAFSSRNEDGFGVSRRGE